MDVKKKENHLPDENIIVGAKPERLLKKLSPYEEKREQAKIKEIFKKRSCYWVTSY